MTSTPEHASGGPGGLLILFLVAGLIIYLFLVAAGRARGPVDIGHAAMSMRRGHGQEDPRSEAESDDDPGEPVDTSISPQDADDGSYDLTDIDAIRRREEAQLRAAWKRDRYRPGASNGPPRSLVADDEGQDDEDDDEPDPVDTADRRQWVHDRLKPGDEIRSRYPTQKAFVEAAAEIFDVDPKTIYRDIKRIRDQRTARKNEMRRTRR